MPLQRNKAAAPNGGLIVSLGISILWHLLLLGTAAFLFPVKLNRELPIYAVLKGPPTAKPKPIEQAVSTSARTLKSKAPAAEIQAQAARSSGRFKWGMPSPEIFVQASLAAQQRFMYAQALSMQLGDLSRRLSEVVHTEIRCLPNAAMEIVCSPEPDRKLATILPALLGIAHEATRLGMAKVPFVMDFGGRRSIEIVFDEATVPQVQVAATGSNQK